MTQSAHPPLDRALAVLRHHRVATAFFCAMWAGIIWALFAFPTLDDVLCLRTGPDSLKWTTVIGDAGIATAYFIMPIRLLLIWLRLKVRPVVLLLALFAAFIFLCGPGTHGTKIAMFWWPRYWVSAKVGLVAAGVSLMVAYVLEARDKQLVGLGRMAEELQAAIAENVELRKSAEARATRAEGEVTELEQAQRKLREALAKAERETAAAERARQAAIESARSAEAARRQAEAAQEEKQAIQRAVKDLSTPILPLTEDIAAMPLIGALDSMRAAQAMDAATDYVSANGVRFLILDLSGVPVVDTQVASALLNTIKAVGLIGGTCIVTGIRPPVAQTMVELGIDMSTVTTRSTLRAGLTAAMGLAKAG